MYLAKYDMRDATISPKQFGEQQHARSKLLLVESAG